MPGAFTNAPGLTRVLVLGASGMLGSTLMAELVGVAGIEVRGTVRDAKALPALFLDSMGSLLVDGVDVSDDRSRLDAISGADLVVNAVGVIKQAGGVVESVDAIRLNALLPHQLAAECRDRGSRLVHVSTDCVFSGRKGAYVEADTPDPVDFYGRSKLLGEVQEPALTLRTSIIGHELRRHASLLDWFLGQPESAVRGYAHAIYSGVTTHEFARLLVDVVIPDRSLQGLYHVASEPITKLELLRLVGKVYGRRGEVMQSDDLRCDRSMRADRLREVTGYRPPPWPEMIQAMFDARPTWVSDSREEAV